MTFGPATLQWPLVTLQWLAHDLQLLLKLATTLISSTQLTQYTNKGLKLSKRETEKYNSIFITWEAQPPQYDRTAVVRPASQVQYDVRASSLTNVLHFDLKTATRDAPKLVILIFKKLTRTRTESNPINDGSFPSLISSYVMSWHAMLF